MKNIFMFASAATIILNIRVSDYDLVGIKTGLGGSGDAGKDCSLSPDL